MLLLQTLLLRYKDRSLITAASLNSGGDEESSSIEDEDNLNQIDKIVIQVGRFKKYKGYYRNNYTDDETPSCQR